MTAAMYGDPAGRALVAAIHTRKQGADMTDRLEQIQARVEAATEGPWKLKECAPCTDRGRLDVAIWAHDGNIPIADWCDGDEFTKSDAEFIAHAREDVPHLLAMVRELALNLEAVRTDMQAAQADAWDEGRLHGAKWPFGFKGLCSDDNQHRAAITATEGAE